MSFIFFFFCQHLLTCDLDGEELRGFTDCVERLNLLDKMGRVWGQNMLLEVNGPDLLLTDTETKVADIRSCGSVFYRTCLS